MFSAEPALQKAEEAVPVTLQPGDFVYFGQYAGEPILWRVLALEDGKPLLLAERILCFKAFAACAAPAAGSSAWGGSALRQWLNSAEAAVEWQGAAPVKANIWGGYNPYAQEPGFLSPGNFDAAQLALLDSSENGDAVSLPTRKQLEPLSIAARKRSPTPSALAGDRSPFLFLRSTGWYWTRDAIATNACSICAVTGKGTFYKSLATDGMNGVCPLLRLRTATVLLAGDPSKGGFLCSAA
jgi:hypothetical protein